MVVTTEIRTALTRENLDKEALNDRPKLHKIEERGAKSYSPGLTAKTINLI